MTEPKHHSRRCFRPLRIHSLREKLWLAFARVISSLSVYGPSRPIPGRKHQAGTNWVTTSPGSGFQKWVVNQLQCGATDMALIRAETNPSVSAASTSRAAAFPELRIPRYHLAIPLNGRQQPSKKHAHIPASHPPPNKETVLGLILPSLGKPPNL